MQTSNVTAYLAKGAWRLLPGNPILVRVVCGSSKRQRDLLIRLGYLAVLFVAMISAVVGSGSQGGSLADTAKEFSQAFKVISLVQLALMCFLAPIFAAAAITQERDAQTYDILLTTPLSNAQIVLGTLCSRLTFVLLLLLSGLPIVCITMVYGGVTTPIIINSFAVAAATAIFTASLAISVSVIQVGTRRTVFTFYMVIAVYLAAVFFLATLKVFHLPEASLPVGGSNLPPVSYFAPFHPFLALFTALNLVPTPAAAEVAHYPWPLHWLYAHPDKGFVAVSLLGSLVLILFCMFFVRSGAKQGERTLLGRLVSRRQVDPQDQRRRPRHVWHNPVAWREAVTRASAMSKGLLRYLYIGGGSLCGLVLFVVFVTGRLGPTGVADARLWLTGLVFIEFATMLLVATNLAASAISREREAQTLDLLLASPLTSKYVIRGKLRGLVSFTLPLILVPVATCGLFAIYGLFSPGETVIHWESTLLLGALMVIFSAFACLLGLFRSLKSSTTLRATMSSVGILVVVCGAASMCGFQIVGSSSVAAALLAPFTPFTALFVAIDPLRWMDVQPPVSSGEMFAMRLWSLAGSLVAIVVYSLIIHAAYKSMVRNFDMTIRKQSV